MKETDTHWIESRCPRSAGRNPNPGDSELCLEKSDKLLCCFAGEASVSTSPCMRRRRWQLEKVFRVTLGTWSLGQHQGWGVVGAESMVMWGCLEGVEATKLTGFNARARRAPEDCHWIWVIRRVLGYSDVTGAEAWGIMVTGGSGIGKMLRCRMKTCWPDGGLSFSFILIENTGVRSWWGCKRTLTWLG